MPLPQTRTSYQFKQRLRRDAQTHGDTPLLERLLPFRAAEAKSAYLHAGVVFLSSLYGMVLFWCLRETATVFALVGAVAVLVAAGLRFHPVCLLLLTPLVPTALCGGDPVVLVYGTALASLALLGFVFCREFIWARTTIPVSVDDLITLRRRWDRPLRLLVTFVVTVIVPAALLLPTLTAQDRLFTLAVGYRAARAVFLLGAILFCCIPPTNKLRSLLIAFQHFTSYNSVRNTQPSVFQSPTGTDSQRLLLINLAVILVGAIEAYPASAGITHPEIPTELSHHLMLFPLGQVLMPVLTLFLGLFWSGRSHLARAQNTYSQSSGNEWSAMRERQALYSEEQS